MGQPIEGSNPSLSATLADAARASAYPRPDELRSPAVTRARRPGCAGPSLAFVTVLIVVVAAAVATQPPASHAHPVRRGALPRRLRRSPSAASSPAVPRGSRARCPRRSTAGSWMPRPARHRPGGLDVLPVDAPLVTKVTVYRSLLCRDDMDCPPARLASSRAPSGSVIVGFADGGPDAWVDVVATPGARPRAGGVGHPLRPWTAMGHNRGHAAAWRSARVTTSTASRRSGRRSHNAGSSSAGEAPRAGLLFATFDSFDPALVREVRDAFPGIRLIGSSSAAEMSSVGGYREDSVTLAVFASDTVGFTTAAATWEPGGVEAASRGAVADGRRGHGWAAAAVHHGRRCHRGPAGAGGGPACAPRRARSSWVAGRVA